MGVVSQQSQWWQPWTLCLSSACVSQWNTVWLALFQPRRKADHLVSIESTIVLGDIMCREWALQHRSDEHYFAGARARAPVVLWTPPKVATHCAPTGSHSRLLLSSLVTRSRVVRSSWLRGIWRWLQVESCCLIINVVGRQLGSDVCLLLK